MAVDPVTGALIMGGASLAGGLFGSRGAKKAARAQGLAAERALAETKRQFDVMRDLMNPYVEAGGGALTAQQNLLGLGGAEAQAEAIQGIQDSPMFQSMVQQGEEAMLQNAAATGGLRGGNLQGALAQYRPQMLNQQIMQRFNQLGGLSGMGQASAAGVGAGAMQTGQMGADLLGQMGSAQAGGHLGAARGWQNMINTGMDMGMDLYKIDQMKKNPNLKF